MNLYRIFISNAYPDYYVVADTFAKALDAFKAEVTVDKARSIECLTSSVIIAPRKEPAQ